MKTSSYAEKKQCAFTLLEFIIVVAIVNCITLLIVPAYQDSMKHRAWAKTAAAVTPLKQAIAQCLIDSKGDVTACNDFSAAKLAKYGATGALSGISFAATVNSNATVKITGLSELGMCVATLTPSVSIAKGATEWRCSMEKQETDGDSLEKCRQYIYDCYH